MVYEANTPDDQRAMLEAIGMRSLDDLWKTVPHELRTKGPLAIPPALSELELTSTVSEALLLNEGADRKVCFLGGGAYDHFIPAVVDNLAARGEFYTAYTPYQAEASQGTLQATFEYQTMMTQLTGLDVSNSSLYDGGSATAEAVLMALAITRRFGQVVIAETVHPEYRQVLGTFLEHLEPELVTVAAQEGQVSSHSIKQAVSDQTAAVVFQYPNFLGQLEDVQANVKAAHDKGALAIVVFDPMSVGLLKRPVDYGADIAVAEGQSLGNHLCYGGPYLGIMVCREEYVRKMPGRIVGETTDRNGKRCYVLTLQTREQHIRREKATSNICTNQGLLALRASIYLAVMGPRGLRQAAELSARKAHYAAERLEAVPGVSLEFSGPFFKEFVVKCRKPAARMLELLLDRGFHAGLDLGRFYPKLADCILVAVTEKRTKHEIDSLAEAFDAATRAK